MAPDSSDRNHPMSLIDQPVIDMIDHFPSLTQPQGDVGRTDPILVRNILDENLATSPSLDGQDGFLSLSQARISAVTILFLTMGPFAADYAVTLETPTTVAEVENTRHNGSYEDLFADGGAGPFGTSTTATLMPQSEEEGSQPISADQEEGCLAVADADLHYDADDEGPGHAQHSLSDENEELDFSIHSHTPLVSTTSPFSLTNRPTTRGLHAVGSPGSGSLSYASPSGATISNTSSPRISIAPTHHDNDPSSSASSSSANGSDTVPTTSARARAPLRERLVARRAFGHTDAVNVRRGLWHSDEIGDEGENKEENQRGDDGDDEEDEREDTGQQDDDHDWNDHEWNGHEWNGNEWNGNEFNEQEYSQEYNSFEYNQEYSGRELDQEHNNQVDPTSSSEDDDYGYVYNPYYDEYGTDEDYGWRGHTASEMGDIIDQVDQSLPWLSLAEWDKLMGLDTDCDFLHNGSSSESCPEWEEESLWDLGLEAYEENLSEDRNSWITLIWRLDWV